MTHPSLAAPTPLGYVCRRCSFPLERHWCDRCQGSYGTPVMGLLGDVMERLEALYSHVTWSAMECVPIRGPRPRRRARWNGTRWVKAKPNLISARRRRR